MFFGNVSVASSNSSSVETVGYHWVWLTSAVKIYANQHQPGTTANSFTVKSPPKTTTVSHSRCLDDDEPPSFSIRRRQFIERCHEARGVRHRDVIPVTSSVKKTREELSRNAAQGAPLNRRLNVESGWSKVEEVRKKFEATAAAASFSRSFESPPR